ncbi:MAG TPA: hypothetical protein VEI03_22870 [Stellaceae bacterium]|nr:hypothetical protein [Stellaceae bacterium]
MNAAPLDLRPAAPPGIARRRGAEADVLRLVALAPPAEGRRRLACHWQRGADGRLTCCWKPETAAPPRRAIARQRSSARL